MMAVRILALTAALPLTGWAAVRSGRGTADWLTVSATCEAGKPLQTAIRLRVDDGWHTYWVNPGEGGMKPGFDWEIPDGWSVSEPGFLPPERFKTGELACFGYSGSVMWPVTVTPPADFQGRARLKVRISWLTCNDESCVPGDAGLSLDLTAGAVSPTPDAEAVRAAHDAVPRSGGKLARLSVREEADALVLSVEPVKTLDLAEVSAFPATPEVIDPAAEIRFTRQGAIWTAVVPKSEYAESPIERLGLIFAGGSRKPFVLTWSAR